MPKRMRGNHDPRQLANLRWEKEKAKQPPDDDDEEDREYREACDEFFDRYDRDDGKLDSVVWRMLDAIFGIWERDLETLDFFVARAERAS